MVSGYVNCATNTTDGMVSIPSTTTGATCMVSRIGMNDAPSFEDKFVQNILTVEKRVMQIHRHMHINVIY